MVQLFLFIETFYKQLSYNIEIKLKKLIYMEENFNEKDKKYLSIIMQQSAIIGELYGSLTDLQEILESKKANVKKVALDQSRVVVNKLVKNLKKYTEDNKV